MQTLPSIAFDELTRGTGGIGATEHIAHALQESGIDVPSTIYDEALALAREGRLAPAAERLRMLLVLDPSDAEAALLLGKVLASRGQWQESLASLDSAAAKGAILPPTLRDEVEAALRRELRDAEEHRARATARERGELRNLRGEAKRLRSENAMLEQKATELNRRVKVWSSTTALVAGAASALLLAAMVFGGPSSDAAEPEELASVTSSQVAEASLTTPVPPTAVPLNNNAPVTATTSTVATRGTAVRSAAATPAPAATATAQPASEAATMHTIRKGETLGRIAQRYYGKSSEWQRILDANDDQLNGSVKGLRPGMKLRIPPKP